MTQKILYSLLIPLFLVVFASTVNAQNATAGNTQTATDAATKLKQQMRLIQDQKKTAVSNIKSEAKALIQAKREEFKTRIQTIKDQKKKTLAVRIDAKLAEVNKKHTAKYSETLIRLQGFLDKIKLSTTNAKVLADATTAQTAIDTAKSSVDIQAAKSYIMEITDDATLKVNAGAVVSQLRQDLSVVHKLVVDAKQAVQKLNTDRELIKKEASASANL